MTSGPDVDRALVQRMYDEWRAGASKSALERRYFGKGESHGKYFTSLVRRVLGEDTEQRSTLAGRNVDLVAENARLRALLRRHGIDPDPSEEQ